MLDVVPGAAAAPLPPTLTQAPLLLAHSCTLQVISNRMQKSVLVAVDRLVKHKKYDRVLKRTTKLMVRGRRDGLWRGCGERQQRVVCSRRVHPAPTAGGDDSTSWSCTSDFPPLPLEQAHDEDNACNVGDTVRVHICRPLSKRKCWEVTSILHRSKQFDADSAARAAAADVAAHAAHGGGSSLGSGSGSGGGVTGSFASSAVQ